MKWNVFSMSDLTQNGYSFSLLIIVLENYSHSTLWNKQKPQKNWEWASWTILFTFSRMPFFTCTLLHAIWCVWWKHEQWSEFLGYVLFHRHWLKTRKPSSRTSHILCQNVLAGIFSCVIILFTSSKQPIIMTISLTYQSKFYHPLCWFFMSSHTISFTFILVIWYLDIIWENCLETFPFQVLMTLTFVLPWVN